MKPAVLLAALGFGLLGIATPAEAASAARSVPSRVEKPFTGKGVTGLNLAPDTSKSIYQPSKSKKGRSSAYGGEPRRQKTVRPTTRPAAGSVRKAGASSPGRLHPAPTHPEFSRR